MLSNDLLQEHVSRMWYNVQGKDRNNSRVAMVARLIEEAEMIGKLMMEKNNKMVQGKPLEEKKMKLESKQRGFSKSESSAKENKKTRKKK
eukprot:763764-Hanusia_phi.AAC.3